MDGQHRAVDREDGSRFMGCLASIFNNACSSELDDEVHTVCFVICMGEQITMSRSAKYGTSKQ